MWRQCSRLKREGRAAQRARRRQCNQESFTETDSRENKLDTGKDRMRRSQMRRDY